jgi:UDPglucose 6-dehydrogenase
MMGTYNIGSHDMKICVVGTGYVGLVVGTCLADFGHSITCVDKDQGKVDLLNSGGIPIYEPGLDDVISRCMEAGRLRFVTVLSDAVRAAEVIFIAVGTPAADNGSADLSGVLAVAKMIGESLTNGSVVVIKSTVPVGTADRVRAVVASVTDVDFDIVSNPEFLAEGTALEDFTHPDRIVVGYAKTSTGPMMDELYAPLVRTGRPIIHMSNRSAEVSKYAANAMLATRITFMNQLANFCDLVDADIDSVRRVVGSDSRIGSRFLFPGCGYGGSCFPKDVQALAFTSAEKGYPFDIINAVHAINEDQKLVLGRKVDSLFGEDWSGKRVAVWGLAFKPQTDDVREAPALVFIRHALSRGAEVVAHDPEAIESTREVLGDVVTYVDTPMEAVKDADVLVIPTDWNAFRSPNFAEIGTLMKAKRIVDGRNLYEPKVMAAAGFDYHCIGRPHIPPATV